MPATTPYFSLFTTLVKDAERQGRSLAVLSLAYSLAPKATYPTQLRQAVEALRYVLENNGQPRSPERILLGGDSAGGNLALGVLAHIKHPHPEISPLQLGNSGELLAGLVALSPWVSLQTEFSEPVDSCGDLVGDGVARVWVPAYLGNRPREAYNDPMLAPDEWLPQFPVKKMIFLAGENEVLLPLILKYVDRLRKFYPPSKLELVVGPRECHVAPVYHKYVGDGKETVQGAKWRAFVSDAF